MSYLEDDLKIALRREEPPEDFTERVLARLNHREAPEPGWWERLAVLIRPPRVQWVALSVIASVMIPVGLQYQRELRFRAEGERAKQQLMFAVRVAGNKLHGVQKKVLENSRTDTNL